MGKKLNIPMLRSGITVKNRKIDQARRDGFNMGILCGCAVLNDRFDFLDEELRDWMDQCSWVVSLSCTAAQPFHFNDCTYNVKLLLGLYSIKD